MTTAKQIAANRRNAAHSTGPRTPAGKNRARANAFKHGFAAKKLRDESKRHEIDVLARALAGQTDPIAARAIAEAQVELQRVEKYRAQLLSMVPAPDEAGLRDQGTRSRTSFAN
jgi:hypothetical protein